MSAQPRSKKRTNGVETVYNRIAYTRYFLVFMLSDYAKEECNLVPGRADITVLFLEK